MKIVRAIQLSALLACGVPSVTFAADCNVRDFLIQDIVNVVQTGETELAFVLTASREEFESAKKSGATGGSYGLISGSANYDEAKDRAQKIATSTSFDYKHSYADSFFTQTVSAPALAAYQACLDGQKETPGLALWLSDRKGDFFIFRAFWVGTNVAEPAAEEKEMVISGGKIESKPTTWIKAKTEQIVVKRGTNTDLFLSVTVGDQTKSVVVVKDPPSVVWQERLVQSEEISVSSTDSRPCNGQAVETTIYAPDPGGFFKKDTEDFAEKTSDPSHYDEKIVFGLQKISVRVWQSTGACEHVHRASGRLTAIEKYPTAAAQ